MTPEPVSFARLGAPRPAHLRAVPAGPDVPVEAHPALRRAAEDVVEAWQDVLADSFDRTETRAVVEWLVTAVEAAAREESVAPPDGPVALLRFLLERLAAAALHHLATDTRFSKEDLVSCLHGVDLVRRSIEPEWDRYFAAQISGPDGLTLVTEVAHDLRSPLTSIRCLAETLERGQSGPVTDLQRKQLRLIYSAALGLGSMATDVIEMARRGDQLVDGEPMPFSVSEVVESVADLVRPIAEEKGVRFIQHQLPTDQRVGMPFALSRVLLNLVTNALKFTDEGSVELQLRATALTRVEFAVVDTGRGIPEAAIADLYRPFRRTSGRSGRAGYLFSGTGLGLALCRKLLAAMGSELRLETSMGNGTRFSFELELPPTTRI